MRFRHNLIFHVLTTKASMDLSHNQPIFYIVPGFWKQYRKTMIQRKSKHQFQVIKHLQNAGWIFFPISTLQRYPKALDFKSFGKIFFLLKHQLLATAKGMIPDWWTTSSIWHGKSCVPLMWKQSALLTHMHTASLRVSSPITGQGV